MPRYARGWWDLKARAYGSTQDVLKDCGGTPRILMRSGKTPMESLVCGGTLRTVVNAAGRWKK